MHEQRPLIEPGTLGKRLELTRKRALAVGALRPIATREMQIPDAGVTFLVRQVDSLARKSAQGSHHMSPAKEAKPRATPFLPPEPELTLGALSATHCAVLNKYNVLDSHLLVVARQFEHQETLLTLADMEALAFCLGELDGLGFYNGGAVAGASQSHKHLQLVPLPLSRTGPAIPMEALLPTGVDDEQSAPPFPHAFARLPAPTSRASLDAPGIHRLYLDLIRQIGIRPLPGEGQPRQSGPYNLLVTRRWMLAVPRRVDVVDGISVNALGFAGSLFVRDDAGFAAIRRRGPMALLRAAAGDQASFSIAG